MRQRNMLQMKEQNITSEKELNEMELSNLPDKEFKVMVDEVDELRKDFNRDRKYKKEPIRIEEYNK